MFAKIDGNKTAIVGCDWFPLNRNILLDKQLCSTMTDEEHDNEDGKVIIIPFTACKDYVMIDETVSTLNIQSPPTPSVAAATPQKPNCKSGMAAWCLDTMVANQDMMVS